MQHRTDPLGIDGELNCVLVARRGRHAFARGKLEQLVRIDRDRIGVDRRGRRDRGGDDVGLGRQTLHPGRDDVGAKLVEKKKADHQDDEAAEIEDDDAAGERG